MLMGNYSWLIFQGGVNEVGVKVQAGVYNIPIKGDLRFNKVEMFIEVRAGRSILIKRCISQDQAFLEKQSNGPFAAGQSRVTKKKHKQLK